MSENAFNETDYRSNIPTGAEVARRFCDRVKGKTIVITGTSDGSIGAVAAKALASAGPPKRLFLLARSETKVAPVIQAISASFTTARVEYVNAGFMDLNSVRRAAWYILSKATEIHILTNFVGIFVRPEYVQSVQGIEQHFATNHLGHFLLTALLMPSLLDAGKGARVVQLSSNAYTIRPFHLENYNFHEGRTYHLWEAYSQADSACILFAREMARRIKAKTHTGLGVFSADPGFVPDSNLNNYLAADHMKGAISKYLEFHDSVADGVAESVMSLEQGAATPLVAALDPAVDGHEGQYVIECKVVPEERTLERWVVDDKLAAALWDLDERLVGEKFL